jgi:serine---pyruvate transaminase
VGALKPTLMVPGPTPLPPTVVAAGARPIVYHRTEDFVAVYEDTLARLGRVFQTEGEVLIFYCTGSGAMASAMANLARPGERVLVASCGNFGERWAAIARDHDVDAIHLTHEWGERVDPQRVADELAEHPEIGVVFTTQSETSTGVVNDLPALREACGDRILVADAVSGLAVVDLPMDAWGIDVVVSGSQKGLMTPPGLGLVAANERALAWSAARGPGGFYLGWERTRKGQHNRRTAFTAPVTLVLQLQAALTLIEEEGLAAVFERHRVLGRACRAAVGALGMRLLGPDDPEANVVTSFWPPEDVDGRAIPRLMRRRFGIQVAGGQGKLSGRIVRIGHCGYYAYGDVLNAVAALEIVLLELEQPVPLGAGVGAAQRVVAEALLGPGAAARATGA